MKRTLKVIALILAVAMPLMAFAACTDDLPAKPAEAPAATAQPAAPAATQQQAAQEPTAAPAGPIVVGLSMQTQGAPYFVAQLKAFEAKCAELGIKCISADAKGDMTKQQSDVEDLVAQGITALVINPADAQGCVAIVNNVTSKGIPVFIMDNSIDPSANYVSMIQSNNLAIGTLLGNYVAEQFADKEILIGILSGNPGNLLGVDRRIGVIKGIVETQLAKSNSTNFKVVTQGWGAWNQEQGLSAAEDMITAQPTMNLIIAENDSMGLGAITALQNAGKADQVMVVGIDGQKEALALVKDGKYGASGLNDPVEVANVTVDTMMKYLKGDKNIPKLINTQPAVINPSNVDQYYKADAVF